MAANTAPIFVKQPSIQYVAAVTTANTAMDLSSGTIYLVFTADATNGSRIDNVYITHQGSNVASVVRFFVNNGSATGTPANNILVHEETLATNTISQTLASTQNIWNANLVLKPGYKLYATTGTTVAAGYEIVAVGGDY